MKVRMGRSERTHAWVAYYCHRDVPEMNLDLGTHGRVVTMWM